MGNDKAAAARSFTNHENGGIMNKSNDDAAAPRPAKQAQRAEVARLARQGLSYREISERTGVNQSTVGKWVRALRRKRAARKTIDPAEAIRRKIERLRAISGELLNAWRRSQADKQVRVVETTGPAGDPAAAKEKNSLRSETQTGNAGYLAQAMKVEGRIEVLEQRLAELECSEAAGPGGGPASLANLSDDDLERLTSDEFENFDDDQLFVIDSRLRAKRKREGVKFERPLLTNEDLGNMNDEQFTAHKLRLQAKIDAQNAEAPAPETQRTAPGDPQPPAGEAESQKNPAERESPPEAAEAETAVTAAATLAPVENPEKVEAPPLTAAEQYRARMRERAARKHKYDRYTDPRNCAF